MTCHAAERSSSRRSGIQGTLGKERGTGNDEMPFKCPKGTKKQFRFRKIKKGKQRIGGCAKKGRFVKVKEIKTFKNKVTKRMVPTKFPSREKIPLRLQNKLKKELQKIRNKRR